MAEEKDFFAAIVYNKDVRNRKFRIPTEFLRKYGHCLSSPVTLEVPVGDAWQVELLKCDNDKVWLDKGWQEFADFYSLDHGHFLLFNYLGGSNFNVVIIDTTASEIDYPTMHSTPVEVLDEIPLIAEAPPPIKTERTLRSTTPTKKSPTTGNTDSTTNNSSHPGEPQQFTCKQKASSKRWSLSATVSEALQAANSFESDNPTFKITVQPHHFKHRVVSVPTSFTRSHLQDDDMPDEQREKKITLQVSKRSWPVKLIRNGKKYTSYITSGWPAFAKENSLQIGDVCVFERIKSKTLKVSIFRQPVK